MTGQRFNSGKPKWGLVPQSALLPLVKALEYGTIKYQPDNWKKGLSVMEMCESLKRHLDDFMEGIDIDPESGLHHIGPIQANAMFIAWMLENKPEFDDRNKVG